MKEVKAVVYRYLTEADFFNMYKPTRTETGGGGQLYIDFLTSKIPLRQWEDFFSGVTGLHHTRVKNGPQWEFPVWSIGPAVRLGVQTLRVYQRRPASICIPNQNINTRSANRVHAWAVANGFPEPPNPNNRHSLPRGLAVFLAQTYDNEIWAGWFLNDGRSRGPCRDANAASLLGTMLDRGRKAGDVGIIDIAPGTLYLEDTNAALPLRSGRTAAAPTPPTRVTSASATPVAAVRPSGAARRGRAGGRAPTATAAPLPRRPRQRTEEEVIASLFGEDEREGIGEGEPGRIVTRIRLRNQAAVRDLKELYQHKCQITGDEFTFLKRDGTLYTEAHHLIPLGYGGADDPRNIIIVSTLIHRMLHYAEVSDIALSRIVQNPDGSARLVIQINGKDYTITWHPQHADRVRHAGQTTT